MCARVRENKIIMEFCGGGSVSDLCKIQERSLQEEQIALVCRESLKVTMRCVRCTVIDIDGARL